jgi:hypothetical protein
MKKASSLLSKIFSSSKPASLQSSTKKDEDSASDDDLNIMPSEIMHHGSISDESLILKQLSQEKLELKDDKPLLFS